MREFYIEIKTVERLQKSENLALHPLETHMLPSKIESTKNDTANEEHTSTEKLLNLIENVVNDFIGIYQVKPIEELHQENPHCRKKENKKRKRKIRMDFRR